MAEKIEIIKEVLKAVRGTAPESGSEGRLWKPYKGIIDVAVEEIKTAFEKSEDPYIVNLTEEQILSIVDTNFKEILKRYASPEEVAVLRTAYKGPEEEKEQRINEFLESSKSPFKEALFRNIVNFMSREWPLSAKKEMPLGELPVTEEEGEEPKVEEPELEETREQSIAEAMSSLVTVLEQLGKPKEARELEHAPVEEQEKALKEWKELIEGTGEGAEALAATVGEGEVSTVPIIEEITPEKAPSALETLEEKERKEIRQRIIDVTLNLLEEDPLARFILGIQKEFLTGRGPYKTSEEIAAAATAEGAFGEVGEEVIEEVLEKVISPASEEAMEILQEELGEEVVEIVASLTKWLERK